MRWFLGVVLLLLAAVVLRSGLLAYAMYVLLGLLVISRLLARNWIGGLTARRRCNQLTAEIGDTVRVTVTVANESWLPVPWVLLEDLLPRQVVASPIPRLIVKGKRMRICMLGVRGETKLPYELHMKMRGYYQIGPVVMEGGDLFGLHRRYRVETEPIFVLVYPRAVPLPGYDLASRRPIGEVRLTHRLYEDPTRIAGVRPYQFGDPLNRVHWRATARTGSFHSKIYEPSTIAGLTILLDFHQAGYHAQGEPFRSELAVTAAASLAQAVYELGQQVGLITNGRDAADRIRVEGWEHDYRTRQAARETAAMHDTSDRLQPIVVATRRGPEQLHRLRETLARVELTDGLTFAQLVTETAGRLPRDATVVAVLPAVTPETALALGALHRQGFAVAAVLIGIDEQNLPEAYGRLRAENIDVRHAKDERELMAICEYQLLR
jgi:uncharacterized repeat protein (TIGR01451 family)